MHIRPATPEDVPLIFAFIQRKADFDRSVGAFSGELQVNKEKLKRTLFESHPFAYVLFAEMELEPVGFALYGFRYSSFAGQPSLWLDDLYIKPAHRSQGAGKRLMQHLVQIACDRNCTHLAWTADARNQRGLAFYDRLGARIIQRHGYRCFLQWTPDSLS